LNPKVLTKSTLESIAYAGGFDAFGMEFVFAFGLEFVVGLLGFLKGKL
jgi:hypothetical protein